jgi:iron complex outermembrane receptor protein
MGKKFIVFLIIYTLSSACMFSQKATLLGNVVDTLNGEKLIGVNVIVNNKALTNTDIGGKFSVELDPGMYKILFTAIGYQPVEQEIELLAGEKKEVKILMKEAPKEMGTYVVSGSRYDKDINKETISMEVLSSQLIKNTNSIDVSEAVNRVPGVQITDGQASIRGGAGYSYGVGSRVNFLLDGVPLIAGDLGNVEWNLVPIENISQIEVMKGASSVFYGSGSLNGVINVITGWPGQKPSTNISVYSQITGDPHRLAAKWWPATEYPIASGLFFNHAQRIKENIDLVVGGNFHFDRSPLQGNNQLRGRINFKFQYRPKKIPGLSFGLNGNFMFERAGRFVLWQNANAGIYQPNFSSDDKYYFLILDPHLKYFDKKGNKHNVTMRYYRKFRYGFDGDIDAVANNLLVDYQYQRKFYKNMFTVTAGAYFNYGWIQSNLFPDSLQLDSNGKANYFFQTYAAAAFGQLEFNYRRWSVVAGVRYELNGSDFLVEGSIPVFRGGINFRAAKQTFLRGSFGQSYRIPSLGERFIRAELVAGFYVLPNYGLKPEKGWNAELGLRQGFNIGKKWTGYADLALYWMEYTDMIQYNIGNYPPDGVGFKALNIGKTRIMGFELTVGGRGMIGPVEVNTYAGYNYYFPADLTAFPGLNNVGNYLDTMFRFFGNHLLDSAGLNKMILPFRNRHTLRADVELTWKNMSVGSTFYFMSTYEYIDPNFLFIELAIPDFISPWVNTHNNYRGDFTMDFRASYLFKKWNAKVSFIVKNLTNLEYMARPGVMNVPRNFNLRLDFNF